MRMMINLLMQLRNRMIWMTNKKLRERTQAQVETMPMNHSSTELKASTTLLLRFRTSLHDKTLEMEAQGGLEDQVDHHHQEDHMEDSHPMYHLGDHHPLKGHNSNNNISHTHHHRETHQDQTTKAS